MNEIVPCRAAAAFLFLLAVLLVAPAGAESFPIGSGELGPALGYRYMVATGASDSGYLVAWGDGRLQTDARYLLYVARLDRNGAILDPEGVAVMEDPGSNDRGGAIASDGTNFLLVRGSSRPYAVRVTRDSVSEPRRLPFEGSVIALAWNGRHYVALVYNHGTGDVVAVLLDRDGNVASGHLDVGPAQTLACRRGECLVAGPTEAKEIRGGVITESMFPPAGAPPAAYTLPPLFPGANVVLAATATGYVTVTEGRRWDDPPGSANGVTVRSHAAGSLAVESQFRTGTIPAIGWAARIVSTGMLVELVYESPDGHGYRVRLGPRGVHVEPLVRRQDHLFSGGPAGPIAVWIGPEYQVRYALRGGWDGAGELLSRSRASEYRPRLARGTASTLAAWTERRTTDTLYFRMLDADGRPRTAPVALTQAGRVVEALAAFDGVHYLVVWEEKPHRDAVSSVHGRFITQEGELAGEQFAIEKRGRSIGSLLWNGTAYALTAGLDLLHLGTSGAELGRRMSPYMPDFMFLEYDAKRNEYAGFVAEVRMTRTSVLPDTFVTYRLVTVPADLSLWYKDGCCTETQSFDTVWSGTAPAIAIRDGAEPFFMIFDELKGFLTEPEGKSLPAAITYPSRLHAERAGNEILVAAGSVLARYSLDGKLLEHRLLAPDATDSALLAGEQSTLLLVRRAGLDGSISRIEAFSIDTPR